MLTAKTDQTWQASRVIYISAASKARFFTEINDSLYKLCHEVALP